MAKNVEPGVNFSILVVDDQAMTRTMLKGTLKNLGYDQVISAEDGADALDRLSRDPFDLIICDWNMPVIKGIDVLRRVRADERTKKIPFIMLTAEANIECVKAAVAAGVTDYIAKPFTSEVLAKKVHHVLKNARGA